MIDRPRAQDVEKLRHLSVDGLEEVVQRLLPVRFIRVQFFLHLLLHLPSHQHEQPRERKSASSAQLVFVIKNAIVGGGGRAKPAMLTPDIIYVQDGDIKYERTHAMGWGGGTKNVCTWCLFRDSIQP